MGIYALITGGPSALGEVIQMEAKLGGTALAASLFLALVAFLVRLFRR